MTSTTANITDMSISHIKDVVVLYVNNLTTNWMTYSFTITPNHPGPLTFVVKLKQNGQNQTAQIAGDETHVVAHPSKLLVQHYNPAYCAPSGYPVVGYKVRPIKQESIIANEIEGVEEHCVPCKRIKVED
ncbi:hypothetical protein SERLADRAFT_439199 [Serpula lacrymans var. lacrymans S7.9]|uniref:Uncharacterized protein n=1 Tax=Serpula lacrymans var. lacrymans (strain S7.9) TaxID=578457 RepID=F8NZ69_SERL9|nr:uncharacterized protein SERLADRAFT_439199 [Serpula lacrymans var. lacrymans S7.9]EGO23889.1 hypothetical protein SERLADRAFT_439199 [Serpula lacrymans var. lacrymans S7.9]